MLGIRFLYFFRGRSNLRFALHAFPALKALVERIPIWGIKIDYSHFFCVSKGRRKAMFVSGALASMLFPLFVLATAWQIETELWVKGLIFALTVGNILFTIPASYLYGDLAKAQRQH
jgi:hypothetical protein